MTPHDPRAEAVAWLVGRLKFEQLLRDLQAEAADTAGRTDAVEPAATPKAA